MDNNDIKNKDLQMYLDIKNAKNKDLNQENANNNGFTVAGYTSVFDGEKRKEMGMEMLPKDVKKAFKEGYIHIHDFDHYISGTTTCLQIPIDKVLNNMVCNNVPHRKPKGIDTAISLITIAMHANQSQHHGGQSFPNFDFDLAPYAEATYNKLYNNKKEELEEYVLNYNLSMSKTEIHVAADKYAWDETKRITTKSIEGFIYNINDMNVRGSQSTFGSINFGLDTSRFGQLISECLLDAQMKGLANGETPIFPILIYKVKKGVNFDENDPNYFLYRKSLKCLSKRLFPNFQFVDSSFNKNPYTDDPRHSISTMGCVIGNEFIEVKYDGDKNSQIVTFEEFYNNLKEDEEIWVENQRSKFKNLMKSNIKVKDIDGNYTKIKGAVKNPDFGNWYELTFSDDSTLIATEDHPLVILGKGRTLVKHMHLNDAVPCHRGGMITIVKKEFLGSINQESYDITTESDTFVLSDMHSHNCRTRVFEDVNGPSTPVGRGNLSFTTINLPMLAKEADGDIHVFYKLLDKYMKLSSRQLLDRLNYQKTFKASEFPFLYGNKLFKGSEDLNPEDELGDVLNNGSLSIGFIGLAETLLILTGKHHGESPESQSIGLEIINYMRRFTDDEKSRTNLNYSLLATPSEGFSGTALKKYIKKFGPLSESLPEVQDNSFFTNSFHVPVWHNISSKRKIDIEAPYHELTNAGHISYIELDGDASNNLDALDTIVRYMASQNMGYASINLPLDKCLNCGYDGLVEEYCPKCLSDEIMRIRRITGYLVGDMTKWNSAKRDEERKRVKHSYNKK